MSSSFNPFGVLEDAGGEPQLSAELQAAVQQLSKRDTVTKLKGFANLLAWVQSGRDPLAMMTGEFVRPVPRAPLTEP